MRRCVPALIFKRYQILGRIYVLTKYLIQRTRDHVIHATRSAKAQAGLTCCKRSEMRSAAVDLGFTEKLRSYPFDRFL